ncbi:MAG: DUF5063 domain-containing protein [Bacteroidales bacterium]|nr:DUF5063 domain-containing protein [Bacteroidales bacterium]
METSSQAIFDKNTIEFVTVAAEYCGFIQRARQTERTAFVGTLLKLLPLLYLKASMLPECQELGTEELPISVGEADYESVRSTMASIMCEQDDYLEVFTPDMAYSDAPILKSISEDVADIYQALQDFIAAFQSGLNQTMNDALFDCKEQFAHNWGQTLLNTLRALHNAFYADETNQE